MNHIEFLKHCIETADEIRAVREQKQRLDDFPSLENVVKKMDESFPSFIPSAASGRGSRPTSLAEIKAEEAGIAWADEPASVFVVNAEQIVNGIAAHLDRIFPSDNAISSNETGKEWVRVDEAARRLSVEKETLERYRNAGTTKPDENNPGIDSQGNIWRYTYEGKKPVTEYFLPIASPDK